MGPDFSDSQYNNLVFITKSCLLHTGPNIKGHFFFQSDIMPKIRKCRVSDCGSTNNETVLYSPNNEELHRTWKHLIDHTGREKYVSFHICAKHFSSSQFQSRYELWVQKDAQFTCNFQQILCYTSIHQKCFKLLNVSK